MMIPYIHKKDIILLKNRIKLNISNSNNLFYSSIIEKLKPTLRSTSYLVFIVNIWFLGLHLQLRTKQVLRKLFVYLRLHNKYLWLRHATTCECILKLILSWWIYIWFFFFFFGNYEKISVPFLNTASSTCS